MNLHLVDIDTRLVESWRRSFREFDEVEILQGDILQLARRSLVSPANSHGFMDGGIDRQYRDYFGHTIERAVQDAILRRPDQMLPVGAALADHTGHATIPYLIVAPTMEMPEAVPADHCSRALRAVFRLIERTPELNGDVYCPGLATWTGRVDSELAAEHMAQAYREWRLRLEKVR
jgi:O-acetyl-ADP-ribose deacetylase (regulator of RNase III)